jgi:hypothetical protein
MPANLYITTIEVGLSPQPLADHSLIMDAQVIVWATGSVFGALTLAHGSMTATLQPDHVFRLNGVDLSQVFVSGQSQYRVTVIAHSR